MSVVTYMFVASKALAQVLIIGTSGYLLARRGVLTKAMLKNLSIMNVDLLTPCLLFSKMTGTLDRAMMFEMWTESVIYVLYGLTALLWTRVGGRVLGLPRDYQGLVDVATFFSNTNTLPVSLIKSIAMSSGAGFLAKDSADTKESMVARGILYAMVFAIIANLFRWSLGMALIADDQKPPRGTAGRAQQRFPAHLMNPPLKSNATFTPMHLLSPTESDATLTPVHSMSPTSESDTALTPVHLLSPTSEYGTTPAGSRSASSPDVLSQDDGTHLTVSGHFHHHCGGNSGEPHGSETAPLLGSSSLALDVADGSDSDDNDRSNGLLLAVPARRGGGASSSSVADTVLSWVTRAWSKLASTIGPYLSPPLYAFIVAFTVICIPPVHQQLRDPDSILFTLWSAVDMCGDACVPIVIISLGGQLGLIRNKRAELVASGSPPAGGEEAAGNPGQPPRLTRQATTTVENSVQRRGIFLVLVGRFLFVPAVAVCLLTVLRAHFPLLVPLLSEDPIFMLTLLILATTPSTMNLTTVAQVTGKFEQESAIILLYSYLLGIPVLSIIFTFYLWLVSTLKSSS